jgi:hypothetical protein
VNSDQTREEVTTICRALSGALFCAALYVLVTSWKLAVVMIAIAVALATASLWIDPPQRIRTPRGGPMIDPAHTVVIEGREPKRDG